MLFSDYSKSYLEILLQKIFIITDSLIYHYDILFFMSNFY